MKMNTTPTIRVSNAFTQVNIPTLIGFSRNVVNSMSGNADFATPNPALADVTSAIDQLDATQQAALDGGRQALIARNAAHAELLVFMRQLAAYVQSHCRNDLQVLVSSGFLSTRTPAPIGPLPVPQVPNLRQGPITGTLTARTGKVDGAYAYNWRVALASAPTVVLQTEQTTATRNTFEALTPGEVYSVQVNALGAVGESDWTAPTSRMVI